MSSSAPPPTADATTVRPGPWSRALAWVIGGSRARWLLAGVLLCGTLPAFFSWPGFPLTSELRRAWEGYWDGVVQRKVDNPWHDYTTEFSPDKNEAKRNFRFLVPLVAHLTHTGLPGVHATRFALQAVLLLCLLLAAERACGDRGTALAAALAIAGTYVGTSVWRDVCRWFDNCAHAFLALALVARSPWLAGAAVLLAAFTDERSLLVVPLLLLFHVFTGSPRRTIIGLATAVPLYLLARIALGRAYGLGTPAAGIGETHIFITNLDNAAAGYWFALEGGWLLLLLALYRATNAQRTATGAALLLAALLPVAASTGVGDFTRSATYAFPAALVALAWLRHTLGASTTELRRSAMLAAVVSLVVPNVFVMGNVFHENSAPIHAVLLWLRAHP